MKDFEKAAFWWREHSNSDQGEEIAASIEAINAGKMPTIGWQQAQEAQAKGLQRYAWNNLEPPKAKKNVRKKK